MEPGFSSPIPFRFRNAFGASVGVQRQSIMYKRVCLEFKRIS